MINAKNAPRMVSSESGFHRAIRGAFITAHSGIMPFNSTPAPIPPALQITPFNYKGQ